MLAEDFDVLEGFYLSLIKDFDKNNDNNKISSFASARF